MVNRDFRMIPDCLRNSDFAAAPEGTIPLPPLPGHPPPFGGGGESKRLRGRTSGSGRKVNGSGRKASDKGRRSLATFFPLAPRRGERVAEGRVRGEANPPARSAACSPLPGQPLPRFGTPLPLSPGQPLPRSLGGEGTASVSASLASSTFNRTRSNPDSCHLWRESEQSRNSGEKRMIWPCFHPG